MSAIEVSSCPIEGLLIIEPLVHRDTRGYFTESYNQRDYSAAGVDAVFVQDNCSRSSRGVLRGLHYQIAHPQAKLVSVSRGKIFDVAVDLRQGSPTFGSWYGLELSEDNFLQFYIPQGFAHGFCVLSDEAELRYKVTDFYHPGDEGGIAWNDPQLAIPWPLPQGQEPILSEKDRLWKPLSQTKLER